MNMHGASDPVVPSKGLILEGPAGITSTNTSPHGTEYGQVMQLDLGDGILDELLKCARRGTNPIYLALGKNMHLQYGTKQRRLESSPSAMTTQVFAPSTETEGALSCVGRVSHTLAIQKAREDVASCDEAMLKLQSQLASAQQAKDSNRIHFVADNSKLPPPVKQTAASLKQQAGKKHAHLLPDQRNGSMHSKLSSPHQVHSALANGTSRVSSAHSSSATPTSTPSAARDQTQYQRAIRAPLIHLLAIRPLSGSYLAKHINCSEKDVITVLEKVGKRARLDESKWDLNDKTYKDLDVWKFQYTDQADRDLAIGRAVSAFDRMRMSQEDPKWQILNAPHERGKGKTLSNLNHLHKGPIQQSNTPRIHVQPSDEAQAEPSGNPDKSQSGRLTPNAQDGTSKDPTKKVKTSEREAKLKRLQKEGPKKAKPPATTKDERPAAKKNAKKLPAPKSEEFVHDSDEEDGLQETIKQDSQSKMNVSPAKSLTPSAASPRGRPEPSTKTSKVTQKGAQAVHKKTDPVQAKNSKSPRPTGKEAAQPIVNGKGPIKGVNTPAKKESHPEVRSTPKKVPSSPAYTPGAKQRMPEANQGGTSIQKTLSRGRTLSSPLKPSPLGSSPPTNASEFENPGPPSQSMTPPSSKKGETPNAIHRTAGHARGPSDDSSKADDAGSSTPSSSVVPLKRKANDLSYGLHGHSSPYVNGFHQSHKKPKLSSGPTPPESDSSTSPPSDHDFTLYEASRFKQLHAKYAKAYQEVSRLRDPPPEKIDRVQQMHKRLTDMKRNIIMGAR